MRGKQTESTRQQYILILKKFLKLIDKSLPEKPTIQELGNASIRYLQTKPNLRKDLLDFRDHIEHLAPKTRAVMMIVLLNYLETNEIVLPKSLRNDLKIRGVEAISEEFIPTNHDLSQL